MSPLRFAIFGFTFAVSLMGCAHTPATSAQYRENSDSMFMNKKEFDVPNSLKEVRAWMQKYSDKCYQNVSSTQVSTSTSTAGNMMFHNTSSTTVVYYPVWEDLPPKGFSLIFRGKMQDYDFIFILTDVTPISAHSVHVKILAPARNGIFNNTLIDNTIEWVNGRGKACSEL